MLSKRTELRVLGLDSPKFVLCIWFGIQFRKRFLIYKMLSIDKNVLFKSCIRDVRKFNPTCLASKCCRSPQSISEKPCKGHLEFSSREFAPSKPGARMMTRCPLSNASEMRGRLLVVQIWSASLRICQKSNMHRGLIKPYF